MQHNSIIRNSSFQDKARRELPIPMGCVAITIGSSQLATSPSDYIEKKLKAGGISKRVSMTKESITICLPKFLLCLADNERPHVVNSGAVNLLETSK